MGKVECMVVGLSVGNPVGKADSSIVGISERISVGKLENFSVGAPEGETLGSTVGVLLGGCVGMATGPSPWPQYDASMPMLRIIISAVLRPPLHFSQASMISVRPEPL